MTISRDDWESLLDRLEDQQDHKAIAASERKLVERVIFTADKTRRMVLGDVPVLTILLDRRGLTQAALATLAGISRTHLNEIEKVKKSGGV